MDRSNLLVAFLLGVSVALGVALVVQSGDALPRAYAQSANGGGQMFAVTGTGTSGSQKDVLFLVDPASSRLLVFEYNNSRLQLGAVRNLEYDLRFQEWPGTRGREQVPTVQAQRDATEKGEETGGRRR